MNSRKIYCYYIKFRKFADPKISNIFSKTVLLSINFSKFEKNNGKIFKEEESIETLKILAVTEWNFHVLLINISDEKIFKKFHLKKWMKQEIISLRNKTMI